MNRTRIEWCDMTWNPVTGCLHGCPYCYAEKIAKRFGGWFYSSGQVRVNMSSDKTYITFDKGDFRNWGCEVFLHNDMKIADMESHYLIKRNGQDVSAPYPFGFMPTFHRYRLGEPQRIKKPQNVFACSMADLFGEWVPDEWIQQVFEACKKAPWHRYLFLTKNPKRYEGLINKGVLPPYINSGYFFGNSITTQKDADNYYECRWNSHHEFKNNYWINRFFSVEPLYEKINLYLGWFRADWVIIGAETGNRKDKIIPKREWIENIVWQCHSQSGHQFVPVFMKDSLAEIWGEPLIQEYPWPA